MASGRYFLYKFSNDHFGWMSPAEASDYVKENRVKIMQDGLKRSLNSTRRKDGSAFTPGWNPGIGEYVKDKGHYKKLLKEKGLIEVGNESLTPQTGPKEKSIASPEMIKEVRSMGGEISDRAADAMISGDT